MRIYHSVVAGVLLLLSFQQANALANYLTNFRQLVDAVDNGDNVRAIIHFDKCLLTEPASQAEVTKRFTEATTRFNFIQYFHAKVTLNDQTVDAVTTSMRMKIFIDYATAKSIILSGRLSVFEDNTATLNIDLFDPHTHKHLLVADWLCDISNGRDDNGLVLFDFF